jgi:hypothetical protein
MPLTIVPVEAGAEGFGFPLEEFVGGAAGGVVVPGDGGEEEEPIDPAAEFEPVAGLEAVMAVPAEVEAVPPQPAIEARSVTNRAVLRTKRGTGCISQF